MPGDELSQVEIYNAVAQSFPGYKSATRDEVVRRYSSTQFDPTTKLYAQDAGRIIAYVTFWSTGRISTPWSANDDADIRSQLMDAALESMRQRGLTRVWAAYRADWTKVHIWLTELGFRSSHDVVNFIAPREYLPDETLPDKMRLEVMTRSDTIQVYELNPKAFGVESAEELALAWWDGSDSPYYKDDSRIVLRDLETGDILASGIVILNSDFADPSQVDAAMPCSRLGAVGADSDNCKRMNGLFSYVASPGPNNHRFARVLLAEARRRFSQFGVKEVAAQCKSNRLVEQAFYRTHFRTQGSFPIFIRDI
jgi:hypothetical protein